MYFLSILLKQIQLQLFQLGLEANCFLPVLLKLPFLRTFILHEGTNLSYFNSLDQIELLTDATSHRWLHSEKGFAYAIFGRTK